ncbi:MAG: hypothetical protein AB7F31_05025 [Parachlamydiales bacterium]
MSIESVCKVFHPESQPLRQGVIAGELGAAALLTFGLYRLMGSPTSKFKRFSAFALSGTAVYLADGQARETVWNGVNQRLKEHQEKVSAPKAKELIQNAQEMKLTGSERKIENPLQRNPVRVIGEAYVVKAPADPFLLNEIAAYEMAVLLGLQEAIPQSWVRKNDEPFVQTFIPNTKTVAELYQEFGNKFDQGKRHQTELEVLTKGFDLPSLQRSILLQLAIGAGDAHFGNALAEPLEEKYRIWSIDHEDMMPESNSSRSTERPFGVSLTVNPQGQPISIEEFRDLSVSDVASFNIALAGLPQANQPFGKEVLESVTMEVGRLETWHQEHQWYSERAALAQKERVAQMAALIKEELQKEQISLTPRRLVEMFVEGHSTYDTTLSPFFRFQKVGKASGYPNGLITLCSVNWFTGLARGEAMQTGKASLQPPEWLQNRPDFSPMQANAALAQFPLVDQLFKAKVPALTE